MKLNRHILMTLIEEGYLLHNRHPFLPLTIYNYSRQTQFAKYWNAYTLMARGLVLDDNFEVVAMPFPKFFNYEEHQPEEIPTGMFEIYDKMDGSLGILFYYASKWRIATRGSFNSDQAIRAEKMLENHNLDGLDCNYTYLFEIIYPENRIVCDYGEAEKLVLLGVVDIRDGRDLPYDEFVAHMAEEDSGFEIVKRHPFVADIRELKKRNLQNEEGYILRWPDKRVKIKFEDYCRLHSIITNVSSKDIWDFLRNGKDINELLDNTPDEFDEWVRKTVADLNDQFEAFRAKVVDEYLALVREMGYDLTNLPPKKDFAIKAILKDHSACLFRLYDGKEFASYIWRQLEPMFTKPFFKEEEV